MRVLTLPVGRRASIDVPATSANLGPGFDCLGLALDWVDRTYVETLDADRQVVVEIEGEGAGHLPTDERNLIVRSLVTGLDRLGARVDGLRVRVRNTIPQGRGLGSSSAAIVAGLAAAHALVRPDEPFVAADWLPTADRLEGHPDNVAAALFGGLVLAYRSVADGVRAVSTSVHPDIAGLVLVPDRPLATEVARSVLPAQVAHRDAAANSGRAALLVHALTAAPELLFEATADWLHQSYRGPAMPESYRLLTALRKRGLAAVISGAGPSVLVLGRPAELEDARQLARQPAQHEAASGFRAVPVAVGGGVRVSAEAPAQPHDQL
ncbi:homoserine kinase [Microlunatus sp. Gsoil 973]|uniref:homoserine kinase n=1 Tax=Microlunatus sp. Gsoil 973 TaxID=2672569 RepID=UPI0012B4AA2E|nr:homoserine kinase [Microlunatus sp. Gsoil 973]QGN32303.1 homoserine kinase [Microlunatus sp. Gsoil 973]